MNELERRRARVSGVEIAYVDEGDGPPVVLLHGFPTNADLWRNLVPLLAPRFRVLAPDLLGYGWSMKPEGADLSLGAQAKHVRELLEGLGVHEFGVVGHGFGGGVAQLLAVEAGIRTLVLLNSVVFDRWSSAGSTGSLPVDDGSADAESAERAVQEAFARGMGHPERLLPEDLELFVRPWRDDPRALVRAARALDSKGLAGVVGHLRAQEIPILAVWGEDDPWLPPSLAERLQEEVGDVAVALLPGCSHFVLEDAPETVTPIVFEFLRLRYLGESHGRASAPVPVDLGVSLNRPPEPSGLPDEES
ncbi:MAG TPA: alpha/beta hydrolase [Actinomycetota bacterium]|jgi:pimeloyl-ACP methyl ester carboxylesterase|nr:alpha/beta hydrolase [Actinomycetota bacterium]